MPQWGTFAGLTVVVLLCLLALTHLTQRTVVTDADDRSADASRSRGDGPTAIERSGEADAGRPAGTDADRSAEGDADRPIEADLDELVGTDVDATDDSSNPTPDVPDAGDRRPTNAGPEATDRRSTGPHADRPVRTPPDESGIARRGEVDRAGGVDAERETPRAAEIDPSELSTGALLANVALSQGLFGAVLIGAAIYAGIPADALGIEFSREYLVSGLLVGAAAGIALYVANEIGAASATRFGFDHDEGLRELLAPETLSGWLVLLVGVLPVIAAFEELLFRAALIGALSAGFGLSPWLLAALSSVAFGLGHGMQGTVGVVVTAALGFVLAAAFVVTGSLLVVVVAHYLINAFEFVVHEGLGFDWASVLESQG